MPAVSLTSSMFTAFENNSSVNVTVMREGDLNSEIVVKLKTSQLVEDNIAIGEGYARNVPIIALERNYPSKLFEF